MTAAPGEDAAFGRIRIGFTAGVLRFMLIEDSFGNITVEQTYASGVCYRRFDYTYDSKGRFKTSIKNPLVCDRLLP